MDVWMNTWTDLKIMAIFKSIWFYKYLWVLGGINFWNKWLGSNHTNDFAKTSAAFEQMTDVKPYHFCEERIYHQKEDEPEFQNDSPSKNSGKNECKPTQISYKLHVVIT